MSSSAADKQLRTIAAVDGETARQILHILCSKDSDVRKNAYDMIATAGQGDKICIQCEEGFKEAENDEEACKWHDGELEVDYDDDTWADHDERCHGPIEPKGWLLKECPDGFMWSCCDARGSEPGCMTGFHRSSLKDKSKNQGK